MNFIIEKINNIYNKIINNWKIILKNIYLKWSKLSKNKELSKRQSSINFIFINYYYLINEINMNFKKIISKQKTLKKK